MKKQSKLPSGVTRLPVEYKPHKKARTTAIPDGYEIPDNVVFFPFEKLKFEHRLKYGAEWRYILYAIKFAL